MSFVHLRTHTEYSVVDGTLRVDDAVAAAARDAQPACAITDLNNLFGAVKFYRAARKKGVKPIIGCDLWLEPEGDDKHGSRLLVLAQTSQGYHNLCELLAQAWTTNAQRAQAFVKWEWLQTHGAGLLALSGAEHGAVGQALLAGDGERAHAMARRLADLFPQRFFIELQRGGLASHERHVRAAVPLAAALKLPVVATHPVQFLEPDDFEAHEARVCVAEGETLANPKRIKRFSREQYFKTGAQMAELFADLPVAIANTLAIAQRCNLQLTLGKPQLPDFPTPLVNGVRVPIEQHFRNASRDGLEWRLSQLFPDEGQRDRERARYVKRLDFELDTIVAMGFPGYFLIVADFIQWAKANGCPVGPGRGSGAGSLVAYSLSITDLDPLQYNLLFERFLNPERVSMPDFDIDFCQANRERVIDYVKDKYGRDAVSQIATFGTMAAKAALRDVGRVLGMGYGHVDSIAKLVVAPPGKTVTLARVPEEPIEGVIYARKEEPEIDRREAAEEEVAELLALATRVEGIVRNVGMHAGGVLIAPGKITDFCPLYQQPGSDSAVSQYDKDDVEAIGLVKFDFLGLATLTILELAKEFIRARRVGREKFDYDKLPLDDAPTYRLFADGKTEAVFQFESRGMIGMLREAKPTRLEDLIALNAMFRPGPMENIPMFCRRKNGLEPIEYPHPLLEGLLAETYGIFVYQEQVMQAAQVLADYSLGGADLLRRAMGKKNAEEMAKQRQIFSDGASKHVEDQAKIDEVFDLMEKFAGYGFNKSHAAAYALLAYHTAWVKVHCTAEFYAANMTVELDRHRQAEAAACRRQAVRRVVRAARRKPRRLPLRAGQRQRRALRPGRDQGHGAGRDRGDPRSAWRCRLPLAVRLRRAHRSPACQQARGRSADQGRRVRCAACRSRRGVGQRRPGLRVGRHARAERASGRPVRFRRLACREHAGAGAGQGAGLEHQGAPDGGEGRTRLLPLRPSVRGVRARGAAVREEGAGRPGGQPRAATAGRHRQRSARRQRRARAHGDLSPRRRQRVHRGRCQRRLVRREPRAPARR
jgi:DNA polymerase III subunit alpha